jgi:hypothetical protein
MPETAILDWLIGRSEELESELFGQFENCSFSGDNKSMAILAMCEIALEHATSLRELIRIGLPTSAMGLLRLQYEAVVRAIWVLYAAPDGLIAKLVAPLTPESAQIASNALPSFSNMLKEIEQKGPPGAHRHLSEFRDYSWRPLNSIVHSGIHAVSRQKEGYPVDHLARTIMQSNNLVHMSAVALACQSSDGALATTVAALHTKYADCLQLKSP